MTPQFSEQAKKHAPWSMSKAELALNCGLAYNLKYVTKTKGVPSKDGGGRIGIAAHAVLESFLRNAAEPIKDIMYRIALDQRLTTPEIDDLVSFAHNIAHFRDRLESYKIANKVKEQKVEIKFGLTADFKQTAFFGKDVFFRGVMDLLLDTEDGHIIILDHKSGNPPSSAVDALAQHRAQLKLYTLAALLLYPDLKGVQTGLHYLANEEIVWDTKLVLPSAIRDEVMPWYPEFLNEAGLAAESATPKAGWKCKFCEFISQCPIKRT